jgi:hypothetical protein
LKTQSKPGEPWQALIELGRRPEVMERWLAISALPDGVRQTLQAMLADVESQIHVLTRRIN